MQNSSTEMFLDLKFVGLIDYCFDDFFRRRLCILRGFNLRDALININPYILKIDSNYMAGKIVERLVTDFISAFDDKNFFDSFVEPISRIASTERTRETKPIFNVNNERSNIELLAEITGDKDFYIKLMELIRYTPTKYRVKYEDSFAGTINRLTAEFINNFCFPDGGIDWEKLVKFVSEEKSPKV